jgi:prevent-host-death family protein
MKVFSVRDAKASLSNAIAESQEQRVVITRHGKPVCVLVGCEGYSIEDVLTATDPEFWKMLRDRRAQGKTQSLSKVRKKLVSR